MDMEDGSPRHMQQKGRKRLGDGLADGRDDLIGDEVSESIEDEYT